MAHVIEDDTRVPDNTAAAGSEEVQLGTARSSCAGETQLEPEDINLSASEAVGDSHAVPTQCSPTSGAASGEVDPDPAVDNVAEPQELQQLLEALQARSNADSRAAQERLLASPTPVITYQGADSSEGGTSVPGADESTDPANVPAKRIGTLQDSSDQQQLLEGSAVQQQAVGARGSSSRSSSSSISGDSWSPASLSTGTPRATGASQAAGRSGTGSRRGSAAGQAARPPGSSGWTPRGPAPGAGTASSGAPKYPRADYAAAEAARRAQQRAQVPRGRRSGSARRLAGARRQLFCAPRGVAAVRRHSRPSSGAAAGDTGDAGAGASSVQRPRSGGIRGRPRRWSGVAAPGVQLYGRVHAWKERNKQRYEEDRRQQEQEALQACTFAPAVNRALPHQQAVGPSITTRPISRPGTAGKVKGSQQPATGGAADALDFRVFMQQQAALDAHSKQPQAHSLSAPAAASLAQPPTEAIVPPSAEGRAGDDNCSAQPGGVDSISIVADATAAAVEASGAQGKEVFSRLYEAGQTSLRRKEAYAKASTAAERAALLSAAPHPLPLPAGLPAAEASRPEAPAGRHARERFIGEAACTFHPQTNLHLQPRSRPGTPKTTPQVQPPVSAMKAADTITPQLAAAAPDLPPAATPEVAVASPAAELAAAADPGHLIGTTDSGGMSAAIEAAHEEAASALARLTYIEARHALATGRSTDVETGILANGVSSRLDWNEFMARQTKFLQVKEEHAQAARAEALPAGRPELCPTSRKLLEHIRGRSVVAAGQASSAPASQTLEELAGGVSPPASFLGREEETFRPKISRDAHARPARTVQEMSRGDALRHELLLEHARHEAAQQQLQELTFRPVINSIHNVGPVISMQDPGRHLAQVAATQVRQEAERVQRQMQKEEEELRACTFKPHTKKLPAYISRMAPGHRSRKQTSTMQPSRTSF